MDAAPGAHTDGARVPASLPNCEPTKRCFKRICPILKIGPAHLLTGSLSSLWQYLMPLEAVRAGRGAEASTEWISSRYAAWFGAVAAMLGGLSITAVVVRSQQASATAEAGVRFQQHTERLQADIVKRFNQVVYGLIGARGVFAATHHHVDRDAFRAYVQSRDLPAEFPGVRGFGFAQRVLRADLERFVAAERADNAPEFKVRTAGNAADLFIVKYVEPLSQNYPGVGLRHRLRGGPSRGGREGH